jgi:hypothetical protein
MLVDGLTICSVVYNDNQSNLFDFMVRSVMKYTDTPPKFIICDNGGNDLDKYRALSNFTIVQNTDSLFRGSLGHGDSLNKIFPLVQTSRTAIIESDCIILNHGWDKLEFPKHKMIASKKGEITGQPYYHMCFMVFGTAILKHGEIIDFRPGKDDNRGNRSYKPHEDVGWRVRDKIRQDEMILIDFKDCKTGDGKYFDKRFQSDEFWMNDIPIVAHFGRGSNLKGKVAREGFMTSQQQLIEWKNIIENKILNKDGYN